MSKSDYIRQFDVNTDSLSKNELEVLKILLEAAKKVSEVYKMQLGGQKDPCFFPKDATQAEIEKAAHQNEQILAPATVVERDQNGKLTATPYHIKYREPLLQIAKKLEEAARCCSNKEFAHALLSQAQSLLDGEYAKSRAVWLKTKPYILDIVIGPIERIEDKMFFRKRSYQAWVGFMNKGLTDRANSFKDTVFTSRRRFFAPTEKVDFMDKAQVRVDEIVIFSGMIAKYHFTATTIPNNIETMEKHGSLATVFFSSVRETFNKRHYPLFNAIFAPNFKLSFSRDDLQRGYLYTVIMHEIARVLIRYRFATARLKEFYPIFHELTVEAVAIKLCGSLLLKDIISQKEMESILVVFLTRIFDFYSEAKDEPALEAYVWGNAILLNSLIASGALKIARDGISWPNFTKMFIATSNLADEMEKVLAEGNYADASHYLGKHHSSLSVFKKFQSALKVLQKV